MGFNTPAPSCWQYCAGIDVGSHGCVLHELDTGRQFHVEAGRRLHWWIIFKQQTSHHSVKEVEISKDATGLYH